ncbi:MAG: hypothetical protein FWG45_06385 [Oscillospiraceae bacterium]|nr:hypothetical protein [Oscillospiraceae bacterium]
MKRQVLLAALAVALCVVGCTSTYDYSDESDYESKAAVTTDTLDETSGDTDSADTSSDTAPADSGDDSTGYQYPPLPDSYEAFIPATPVKAEMIPIIEDFLSDFPTLFTGNKPYSAIPNVYDTGV